MKAEQYMSYDQTILYIESIRPFHNSGKPLAHYNAAELSRFLNNDAHFGKLSKRTDNTQVNNMHGNTIKERYTERKLTVDARVISQPVPSLKFHSKSI
jgi:hypothetical protein